MDSPISNGNYVYAPDQPEECIPLALEDSVPMTKPNTPDAAQETCSPKVSVYVSVDEPGVEDLEIDTEKPNPNTSESIQCLMSMRDKVEVIEGPDYPSNGSTPTPPDKDVGDIQHCMTFQNVFYKESRSPKMYISVEEPGVEIDREKPNPNTSIQCHDKVEVIKAPDYPSNGSIPTPPGKDMGDIQHCMTFQNVFYEVSGLTKCNWTTKTILSNVSGVMVSGVNAIMGPTGGGKTTLLDILAKRKGTSGLSQKIRGSILLDGKPLPSNFKTQAGYVVQEDMLEGILTVQENLSFSAALRLPRHVTRAERNRRVKDIIKMLGLSAVASNVVGTEFIRGVSGGERKRTVIGMELVVDPSILFLDEPTTGLDAHTAVSVIQSLQDWSRATEDKKLVIMSIHQPRYSIYKLFDTLTLLSLGRVVYQGRASHAVEYFERLGFGMEERENPADFLLDIINDSQSVAMATLRRSVRKVKPKEKVNLIVKYKYSNEAELVEEQLEHSNTLVKPSVPKRLSNYLGFHCRRIPYYIYTFFWQILILGIRSTVSNWRNPSTMLFQVTYYVGACLIAYRFTLLIVTIAIMTFIAIVIGVVYFQLDDTNFNILDQHVGDRIGAMFLIVLTQEFGVLSGFDLFISQRALFIHENSGGFYRVSSYFVSKIITDVIPLRIFPLLLFSVIIYFMIGFQIAVDKFFIFLLILSLGAVTLSSIAFAISAVIKNRSIAVVVFSLINLFSILFSGIAISLSALPDILAWLQYLSVYSYVVQALAINEIAGQFFNATPDPVTGICNQFAGCLNGTLALETNDFQTDNDFIWISMGALFAITAGLWVLTYILLRCAKKHK